MRNVALPAAVLFVTSKYAPARVQEAAFIGIIGFSAFSLGKFALELIPQNKTETNATVTP